MSRPIIVGDFITDYDGKKYQVVSISVDIAVVVDAKGQERMLIVPKQGRN